MPDFDLDAALTPVNPLAGAPIYLRDQQDAVEVYAHCQKFYHYVGSVEYDSRNIGLCYAQSPFEVHVVTVPSLNDGIDHLVACAADFWRENPHRFWHGRKSHLVNAKRYKPDA